MAMKILYITHQLTLAVKGGAEVQLSYTKQFLEKKGVSVKLFNMWDDCLADYDLIHLFNIRAFPYESKVICEYAKQHDIPIVISPIFWFTTKHTSSYREFFYNNLFYTFKKPLFFFNQPADMYCIKKGLELADCILPNTQEEKLLIKKLFGIKHNRFSVIPNATDEKFKYGNPNLFIQKYGLADFVLFAGRIHPHKNLLRLLRAFSKLNLKTKLIILGMSCDNNYLHLLKSYSPPDVVYLPEINHDSDLLASAYKAAKVLVLPSYYETPGLSALEAGLAGSNLVLTRVGGTKEYFGNHAWYVDPFDIWSIKDGIERAYLTPKSNVLSEIIMNKFNWGAVAQKTLNVYSQLL